MLMRATGRGSISSILKLVVDVIWVIACAMLGFIWIIAGASIVSLMTGGAPRGQTFTSVYWIYQNSFVYFKLGYGSALSIILMLVIMAASALQLTLQNRGAKA